MLIFAYLLLLITAKNLRLVGQKKMQKSEDPRQLVVHLIAHSHDDVGWLKTYEEYYYGRKNNIQEASVQYTIDSVMRSLYFEEEKKFIQVEIAFFKKWWLEQNQDVQNKTRILIERGQLVFVAGGWCMNDEASSYYEDIIDQMTLGHRFLIQTFNVTPSIGWQIDPFGHSSTQANLFRLMGFQAWFFSRIDYQDMNKRKETKSMEMIMNGLFTHVQYNHYEAPTQFTFDQIRSGEPVVDDPNSEFYDVEQRAQTLISYFQQQADAYQGNILLHTYGSDFAFQNAVMNFKNMDRLIKYVNSHSNIIIKYSTPEEYIKEVAQQSLTYPIKTDDFFPYADRENAYWTGYFTSRVSFKYLVKQTGRDAQAIKKLISILLINGKSQVIQQQKVQIINTIQQLEEALGTAQHHDAITGTAKQAVNDDYIMIISKALSQVNKVMNQILQELVLFETKEEELQNFTQCNWNVSYTKTIDDDDDENQGLQQCIEIHTILNQSRSVQINLIDFKQNITDVIRIKIPKIAVKILDNNNNMIQGDILCVNSEDDSCDLFFVYTSNSKYQLQYFKIIPDSNNGSAQILKSQDYSYQIGDPIQFQDQQPIKIDYQYYQSSEDVKQKSGAYIFRPKNNTPSQFGDLTQTAQYFNGSILEAISISRTNIDTVIRNFRFRKDSYEIQTFLKNIPINDGIGKEVIMKINTNIENTDFYTDSNGMDLQKRIVNNRPTWDLEVNQEVAGNYYPINLILINDTNNGLAVINDRAQGGTSLRPGEIEIMINRRILRDDARGVGEPLNEVDDDGKFIKQYFVHQVFYFKDINTPREYQYRQDMKPLLFISNSSKEMFTTKLSSFKVTYPNDILKILNQENNLQKVYLQPYSQDQYIYRIHNMHEEGDFSVSIEFENYDQIETTLTCNQDIVTANAKQMSWNGQANKLTYMGKIGPQQIYSYLLKKKNSSK